MTPEQQRLERARQQITSSTSSPPTGIGPGVPRNPGSPQRESPRQPLSAIQMFFAVFFAVLLASMVWSLLVRLSWELGLGVFF